MPKPNWTGTRPLWMPASCPAKKQLSLMSRMLNIRSLGLLMFDHRVQDDQELAHASSQSHFPGLARPTKTAVKGLDDRVISGGG
jgi:hypothetical protein